MKIRVGSLAAIMGLAALWFALPAFGQSDGSTFNVTFSTTNNSIVVGDGYADPYSGTVSYNGSIVNSNGLIICDDYSHNIYNGENWSATGMQASTLTVGNVGNTRFGGTTTGLIMYAEVASLVTQMLGTTNNQQQADLSAAIWWITSAGAKNGSTYSFNGVTLDANATVLLNAVLNTTPAALLAALAKDTNLWILTPTDGSSTSPQEMWMSVPEGGTALLYLLLAGVCCFGAITFNARKGVGKHRLV
jgi:hypothetical protein